MPGMIEREAQRIGGALARVIEGEVIRLLEGGATPKSITVVSKEGLIEREIWVGSKRKVSINLPFSGLGGWN